MSDSKWTRGAEGYFRQEVGYVVVVDDPDHVPVPLCCDICDLPMAAPEDQRSYLSFGCCDSCYLRWVQSRTQAWRDGWRPSPEELAEYVRIRQLQVPKFQF